jgi:hypothetical protein
VESRTFEASLERSPDDGGVFVQIPFDVRTVLGAARAKVRVTIGSHTWRSTVAVYGGQSYLPVSRANRELAGVVPGDHVRVTVALDSEPRMVELEDDVRAAIDHEGLRAEWAALSFSHQREYAESIAEAKRADTRQRRIAALLDHLRNR